MTYTNIKNYLNSHHDRLVALDCSFEEVVDNMPFPIILIDDNYTILFANTMFIKASGLSRENYMGKNYYNALCGQNGPEENCPVKECVQTGKKAQGEGYHKLAKKWLRSFVQRTSIKSKTGGSVFVIILEDITNSKIDRIKLEKNILKQKAITESGITAIYRIIEARDAYTATHQSKVGDIAYLIAKKLGKSDRYASGVRAAGMLHDVGKITVPIEILCKSTSLTDLEYQVIKNHPIAGYEILKDIEYEIPIADIALQHHERIDGSGYPYGIKGNEIHESTKIVSVADVLDAITSHRPYREAKDIAVAISHLREGAGKIYDEDCAMAALELCEKGFIQPSSITSNIK